MHKLEDVACNVFEFSNDHSLVLQLYISRLKRLEVLLLMNHPKWILHI